MSFLTLRSAGRSSLLSESMTSTLPPLVQAVSGAIGSASANALTYPFDLLTTRLQLEPSRKQTGIWRAIQVLREIARKDGWEALYDGLSADTIATLLSNFFYFYCYSFLRSLVTSRRLKLMPIPTNKSINTPKPSKPHSYKPTMIEELVLGFVAGVASRAISTPLNIVTLRLQTQRQEADSTDYSGSGSDSGDINSDSSDEGITLNNGIRGVFASIYKEEGLAGFWRGFKLSVLLSLNPSISLALFQLFRRILAITRRSRFLPNPTPREAFISAAISNSIAVSLLYPLLLAKTRLQASSDKSNTSLRQVLIDSYTGRFHRCTTLTHTHHESDLTMELPVPTPYTKPAKRLGRQGEGGGKIANLYQALSVQVLKGFLNQGMTFLVKGRIEQLIVKVYLMRMGRL